MWEKWLTEFEGGKNLYWMCPQNFSLSNFLGSTPSILALVQL